MLKKFTVLIILLLCNVLLSQNSNIPIFAFHGVPPGDFSTKGQFDIMKKAGIDICYTVYNTSEEIVKALDAAQKSNVKLVVRTALIVNDTEKLVNLIKDHPALYGYGIMDEPSPSKFDNLNKIIQNIRKYDKKNVFYINLFPNYVASNNIDNYKYEDYLQTFINKVPVTFLSFDNYPLVNNKVRDDWYENLELISRVGKKNNIPFWAFACTTIHYNYLKPTLAGIKLQQFSNLLYGARVLQYFTYWTLTYEDNWIKEKYSYSIVDDKGKPTPTYDIVKTVNEQIQRLSWVFFRATSDAVFHTGNEIPLGTKRLTLPPKRFKYFSTNGRNALVSFMTNKKNKFIIIQNKSLDEDLVLNYQLEKPVKVVENNSGRTKSITSTNKLKTTILPGDILIFTYDN
ncbi:hypothetical protein AR438_00275 [Chryseobacterium aquaticum]|uniref:Glycoside hydrolase family 42 N-terminal domain-containing protein n=1 Tax=Chryseobacterium aquaticum TaxID=452084 RepID=A0A0Q3SPZ4_9FLAO|nr:hypothetical protein [Chryseobacterium aquaticum]KQK27522.1 hypothetical protein AR438_00275 [Chryseobacterium aquaticum]